MIIITKMSQEEYFSIAEVAKIFKVTYLTVYRWVHAKKLVALKAGKQYRIRRRDLDFFLGT